jgi:hypothetical protein
VWLQPSSRQANTAESLDATDTPNGNQPARRLQGRGNSILAQLVADENAIEQRKQNVRRFGAGWIRPPGIAKTYQATMDELAEREEQEILARRDMQLQELANAQELEAQRQQQQEDGGDMDGAADADGEGQRDLDDEVPEAEDITFNEESLVEGSQLVEDGLDMDADLDAEMDMERMLDMEEADMTGMLDERDLDDDVPEAGSYQHTDTEAEDDSEIGEVSEASLVRVGAGPARHSMLSEGRTHREDSPQMSSSPAARRVLARGNAFRDRLMQGRQPQ